LNNAMTDADYPMTQVQIDAYRRDGFVQISDVVTGDALSDLRNAVVTAVEAENQDNRPLEQKGAYEQIFIQKVNLWRRHEAVRRWATCRRFANLAARLSGRPVRMWHDQALFKEPEGGKRTPWHQDAYYWPHTERKDQITIWIALRDVTIRNGCMAFLPGTQNVHDVQAVDLGSPKELGEVAPKLKGIKPVVCELPAGGCTFHNGMTFHYAGTNKSDAMREAFAIIYMADGTVFSGKDHVVTLGQGFKAGEKLQGELFPLLSDIKV
jgi:phytanoyl-CoA hydroxylase